MDNMIVHDPEEPDVSGGERMKKSQKWVRRRHKIVRDIANATLGVWVRLRYHVSVQRIPGSRGKQYLLLYNHQTPMDQFLVGMTVRDPVYYLATEDIFSNGFISSIIRWAVAPIPIKKSTMDIKAIISCLKVVKEGGSLAIAPEGNRTYSGKTEYIKPSIASLARKLGLPIALVRIEGGYGVQPRWSDKVHKGHMKTYVSRLIPPEEYAGMTDEQLYEAVRTELTVNEARADAVFRSKRPAEYLERAVYVCPDCGFAAHESRRDVIRCTTCGKTVRYGADKTLTGVGSDFPFRFVNDWYEYQKQYINSLDTRTLTEQPLFTDTVTVRNVILNKHKELYMKRASLSLYGDRIVLTAPGGDAQVMTFEDVKSAAVLGRNKLNLYVGDRVLQITGGKRFNALKYVNLYYRYQNLTKEGDNEQFLGL